MALHTNTPLGMIHYHSQQKAKALFRLANSLSTLTQALIATSG